MMKMMMMIYLVLDKEDIILSKVKPLARYHLIN